MLCADGYSAVTTVQLRVQPASTDRPIFSSVTYVTYIDVNMSVGDFVVAVAASGAGYHGSWPTYHIVAGNEGSVFTIEPHTGLSLFQLLGHISVSNGIIIISLFQRLLEDWDIMHANLPLVF